MKNIVLLLCGLLAAGGVSAQCVKGISTNPEAPVNNEFLPMVNGQSGNNWTVNPFLNGFNWGANNGIAFEDIPVDLSAGWSTDINTFQGTHFPMLNPYSQSNPSEFDYLWEPFNFPINDRDFHWEDGWELLWMNLGYYPMGTTGPVSQPLPNSPFENTSYGALPVNIPYFILYNRYRGTLRIFANAWFEDTRFQDIKVELKFPDNAGVNTQLSGILRHVNNYDKPLDQVTDAISMSSARFHGPEDVQWMAADFQLAYDPCLCFNKGFFDIKFTSISDLIIKGTSRGLSIQQPLNTGNYMNDDFLNISDLGTAQAGTKIYKRSDGLLSDYQNLLNAYNTQLADYNSSENQTKMAILDITKAFMVSAGTAVFPGSSISKGIEALQKDEKKPVITDPSNPNPEMIVVKKGQWQGINGKALETSAKNASKTILGHGFDFLSTQLLNPTVSKPTRPSPPTGTFNEAVYEFTMTENNEQFISPLLIPGTTPGGYPTGLPEFTPYNYPAYNEVLGLFAVLKTPKLKLSNEMTGEGGFEYPDPEAPEEGKIFEFNKCQEIAARLDQELVYRFNPAIDFDMDLTNVYASLIIETKGDMGSLHAIGQGSSQIDHDRVISDNGSNMVINHYIATGVGTDETIIYASPFLKVDQLSGHTFAVETCTDMIYSGLYKYDRAPYSGSGELEITKIHLKVMADMYFEQRAWNGGLTNTTQVFTIELYNGGKEIDFVGEANGSWSSPGSFIIGNPFTTRIGSNMTIGPNSASSFPHPGEFTVNGNEITIQSHIIEVNGTVTAAPGYEVFLQASKEVRMLPSSKLGPGVTARIHDPYDLGAMEQANTEEVINFCNDPENGYRANRPSPPASERLATALAEDPQPTKVSPENPKVPSSWNMEVYPNPTRDITRIQLTGEGEAFRFQVTSITGKIMIDETVNRSSTHSYEIDLSGLSQGMYLLNVLDNSGTPLGFTKIVKQ